MPAGGEAAGRSPCQQGKHLSAQLPASVPYPTCVEAGGKGDARPHPPPQEGRLEVALHPLRRRQHVRQQAALPAAERVPGLETTPAYPAAQMVQAATEVLLVCEPVVETPAGHCVQPCALAEAA